MIDYENEAAEVRARINLLLKEKGITQNAVAAGDAPYSDNTVWIKSIKQTGR